MPKNGLEKTFDIRVGTSEKSVSDVKKNESSRQIMEVCASDTNKDRSKAVLKAGVYKRQKCAYKMYGKNMSQMKK